MKRSLPNLAIRHPISTIMLILTVVGLGVIAWFRIPVEFIPKLDIPFIACVIPYIGATPEQVENEVAILAEGEFRTIPNVKRISSVSDSNGCQLQLMFDWDADMGAATADMRDRMERLKLKLPAGVDRMYLRRFSSSSMPILAFALLTSGDQDDLAHVARTQLQPRLLRLEGVADVMVYSRGQKEVLIEFDQDALRSQAVSLYQVVSALQGSSLNVSVGDLTDGGTRYYVRALDEFVTPEQIADLVVGTNGVRLKQVAEVGYRTREVEMEYSIDRKSGLFVLVRKESEANTIAVCKALRAELDAVLKEPTYKGVSMFTFMDQSELILTSLRELRKAGEYGGGLAVLVLWLFLRRFRPTAIVTLSIPTSFVAGFVFMYFAGMTLNVVTMISMIIAVGMLVDDSIVVIENIHRLQELGVDVRESSLRGANEVAMAISASTLTTLVVFIPILFLQSGEMSTYMQQFSAPMTVSLGASLVVALTLIPLATSHMRHRMSSPLYAPVPSLDVAVGSRPSRVPRFLRGLAHPLSWVLDTYSRGLALALRWRLATTLLLVILVVVTLVFPYPRIGRQGMPKVDTREIDIEVTLDQNMGMTGARNTVNTILDVIDSQRNELGIKNVFTHYGPSGGSIYAYLYKPEDEGFDKNARYSTEQVLDILWQRMPERIPGAELRFAISEASESATHGITLFLRGEDADLLEQYAERFQRFLSTVPEIQDVFTDAQKAAQEMQLRVNDTLVREMGVSPLAVAQTVDFALRGIRLQNLKQGGREIPVWAQFREEDRKTRANLDNVAVLTARGELVPLNQVVSMTKAQSPVAIRRIDGKTVVTITAKTFAENLTKVVTEISRRIKLFDLPRGYTIDFGQEFAELMTDMANFMTAMFLAIILVYIVMAALFESYVLPISILTTIPLAGIGVIWALYVSGTPFDTVSMIGVILMIGVIVKNGIVIVDHMNQLRLQGMSRADAVIQAGRDRFRPVVMTALTTILGCVPLAIGSTIGQAIAFTSLGRALIGGLTIGTLLTLVVVPLFYTIIDDLRLWVVNYFASLARFRRRPRPAPDPAE